MNLLDLDKRYVAPYGSPFPVVFERGQGVWLWDTTGRKYLDLISSFGAISQGHCHPRLLKALQSQAQKLTLVTRNAFHNETVAPLLKKLCDLSSLDMGVVLNSGVEAFELAVKVARRWGYRVKGIPANQASILVATDNFHGRTITAISCSSEESYRADFGPFTPGFHFIPLGDSAALAKAITPHTCAFIVEPMQGESGVRIPPQGWLKEVERICKEKNVLLILDEIQTGLGRTGKMFAFEHEGVQPDGLILAKALGGGVFPISAFLGKKEVLSLLEPGSHGSTYGGNPLGAAVALEAIQIIEDEKLSEKSAELGTYMLQEMQRALLPHPLIRDLRGKGLFIGLEIDPERYSSRALCEHLFAKGVIVRDTRKKVLRFAPPLVIEKKEIDLAIAQLKDLFSSLK